MTTLGDYDSAAFWAASGMVAPWLMQADPAYWREMIPCIGDNIITRKAGWRDYVLTPEGQEKLRRQLCTRISQVSETFVPWLEQARSIRGLNVLEIGCGSGSSTAGLQHAGARVTGLDIKGPALAVARRRLQLLGLEATFIEAEPEWLDTAVDLDRFAGPYDLVVCYALIEHLRIHERLNLLDLVKRIMQRDGAAFATFEMPNRLAPFDWHSTKLAFSEVLPDELAYAFVRRFSPVASHPAKHYDAFSPEAGANLYRRGRGVSWHEFALVFGLETLEVVLDGYDRKALPVSYRGDAGLEAALAAVFAALDPPVPRGFALPSLDFLFRLRGRA